MSLPRDCDPPRVREMPVILMQADFPSAPENRQSSNIDGVGN